jgi:hypothetical protein
MKNIRYGEVWFAKFPYEENKNIKKSRPVIVLDVQTLEVLSVKVTKTEPRENDEYDTPILYWEDAKLRFKSTARISKTMYLSKNEFSRKLGDLHSVDLNNIQLLFMQYIQNQNAEQEVASGIEKNTDNKENDKDKGDSKE